jgi:hypothetical protein
VESAADAEMLESAGATKVDGKLWKVCWCLWNG